MLPELVQKHHSCDSSPFHRKRATCFLQITQRLVLLEDRTIQEIWSFQESSVTARSWGSEENNLASLQSVGNISKMIFLRSSWKQNKMLALSNIPLSGCWFLTSWVSKHKSLCLLNVKLQVQFLSSKFDSSVIKTWKQELLWIYGGFVH